MRGVHQLCITGWASWSRLFSLLLVAAVSVLGCVAPVQYQPQERALQDRGVAQAQQQLNEVLGNAIVPKVTSAEVSDNALRYMTPVGANAVEKKLPLHDIGSVNLYTNNAVHILNRDKTVLTPFVFKNEQDAKLFIDLLASFRAASPSQIATSAPAPSKTTPTASSATTSTGKTSVSLSPGARADRRVALVIGNSKYQHTPPLKNPVNDAQDIAKALRDLQFQVIVKTDASLNTMTDAIFQFGESLKGGGVGLFYYAGHGVQVKGENYLIPVDAHLEREDQIKQRTINAKDVLDKMDEAKSHLNLVFLDACRNNPFPRSTRAVSRGLKSMDAPSGTLLVFATNPDNTASDGQGRNGIYTKHLLTHIKQPKLEVGIMLRKVRTAVKDETGGQQVPWENGSIEGEFYFAN